MTENIRPSHLSPVVRKPAFAYAKTKTQISFAETAKLISAFVFATRIVQSPYFLKPKFQVSSHPLWLYSPACVRPGRKPRRPVFSERGSFCSEFDVKKEVLSGRDVTHFVKKCIPDSYSHFKLVLY